MDADELAFAGVARQLELMRSQTVSSRELVDVYLDRIARFDPQLNAFRIVFAERARAEGDQADARRAGGDERPLLGVPVAIKDNLDIAGEVTAHGSNAYGPPAREDAELVQRLRTAGAVVLGKTHLSELAIWPWTETETWGATQNPWMRGRTPGGSSGGSGCAVAAGLAAAASATDGGGSIRIPAACNGLFGLKPQRGRVSLAPSGEHWYGLTVAGVLTRSVLDTALLLDVLAGNGFEQAARRKPDRLRVAVSLRPPTLVPVDTRVRAAVEAVAERLRSLGHTVAQRDPQYGLIEPLFIPRWLAGIRDDAHAMPHSERLDRRTRALVRAGAVAGRFVDRTRAAEPARARQINALFDDFDVLLTPTLPQPAWPIGRFSGLPASLTMLAAGRIAPFTAVWNMTGQPAASLPAGTTDDGLPIGAQLIGRPNDEQTLLSLSAELEADLRWTDRTPQPEAASGA